MPTQNESLKTMVEETENVETDELAEEKLPSVKVLESQITRHEKLADEINSLDMTTAKGYRRAKTIKAPIVKTRTAADKVRKAINAETKSTFEKFSKRIEVLETPLTKGIKAYDEIQAEKERLEREKETARINAHREMLDDMRNIPSACTTIEEIDAALLKYHNVTPDMFEEFSLTAETTIETMRTALEGKKQSLQHMADEMAAVKSEREAMAAQLKELEELRAWKAQIEGTTTLAVDENQITVVHADGQSGTTVVDPGTLSERVHVDEITDYSNAVSVTKSNTTTISTPTTAAPIPDVDDNGLIPAGNPAEENRLFFGIDSAFEEYDANDTVTCEPLPVDQTESVGPLSDPAETTIDNASHKDTPESIEQDKQSFLAWVRAIEKMPKTASAKGARLSGFCGNRLAEMRIAITTMTFSGDGVSK